MSEETMTPKQFEEAVRALYTTRNYDPEHTHYELDKLCWRVLKDLGYMDIDSFLDEIHAPVWYA